MRFPLLVLLLIGLTAALASSEERPPVDPARLDAVATSGFSTAPADWQSRLVPDETMRQCSAHHNNPPVPIANAIREREQASVVYPSDGQFLGDWKKGEAVAQSGYGLRFTDYPPRNSNGGNCYGCHQITKQEISFGTLGPSLLGYGKMRGFGAAEAKAAYQKIYNSQAVLPCSNMPRFGTNKILSIDQIKDVVSLLMSPQSPANE